VLEFAVSSDDRSLAVALDLIGTAERVDEPTGEQSAEGLELGHGGRQIGLVATRERVADEGHGGATPQRRRRSRTTLVADLFEDQADTADGETGRDHSPTPR
jgi:hypothetical protein